MPPIHQKLSLGQIGRIQIILRFQPTSLKDRRNLALIPGIGNNEAALPVKVFVSSVAVI